MAAARDIRERPAQDGAVVSRQPGVVAAHPRSRLRRRAPWGAGVILVFGGKGQLGRELDREAAERHVPLQALTRAEADIADAAAVATALKRWKPDLIVNA